MEKILEHQQSTSEKEQAAAQVNVQLIAEKDAEVRKLSQQLEAATTEITSLIAYLEAKPPVAEVPEKGEAAKLLEELSVSNAKVEELSNHLAELQTRFTHVETELKTAEALAAEASERCNQKESEIEQLRDEVQKVTEKVVEATQCADEMAQHFRAQLAQAQEDIAARDSEIVNLRCHLEQPADANTVDASEDSLAEDMQVRMRLAEELNAAKEVLEKDFLGERETNTTLREKLAAQEREAEELLATLNQTKEELSKESEMLREELSRVQQELATKDGEVQSAQMVKEELTAVIRQIEEDKQREVAELTVKLQLANELKEMKVVLILLDLLVIYLFPDCRPTQAKHRSRSTN